MGSMLTSSVVDRGFIGGVMGSMLASSVVDRGFIGGVMDSMLASSVVDREFEPRLGHNKDVLYNWCLLLLC
jgi:fructose-specific phosphotransferase system IIC component